MATQIETQVLPSVWDGQEEVVINAPAQASTSNVPRNVRTEFGYYAEPEGGGPPRPLNVSADTRINKNWQPATVYDVRGSSLTHTLDTTGFQYVKHKSAVKDFSDDTVIKDTYYSEITDLLTKITGASNVLLIPRHNIRQVPTHPLYTKEGEANESGEGKLIDAIKGPIRGVHVDQSYAEAPKILRKIYPDKADQLLKGRFQIINMWRPVKTIYKDPLAVIDATTVLENELIPHLVIQPEFESEPFAVRPPLEGRMDGGHKWYYMSHQTPEDVLLFKTFDSKTDGRARRVPHSAFEDKEYKNMETRVSIEMRAFVFHEDDLE